MHGWWGSEAVARDKFIAWGGAYGEMTDATTTLIDEDIDKVLKWPDDC